MDIAGVGKRVRIYVGESDQQQGQPLFLKILEALRAEGCAGATVVRGVAGFGAGSRIHTATILRLSEDLPVVIEWVDGPERVDRVLPKITAMVHGGMITIEEVQVVHYAHRRVREIGSRLRVREVMTRDVVAVRPETPLREAVELLLGRSYRALPVVDDAGRIVGIVTNTDLVERGGMRVRLEMLSAMSPESLRRELQELGASRTVDDVMTREITTVGPEATLADAAHLMVTRGVKRLPVVGEGSTLVGMVSRLDLLRSISELQLAPVQEEPPRGGLTTGDIMRTDVPTVAPDAQLGEVLQAVVSTRLNRAIVVDGSGRVVGVVSDAELVRRLSPKDRPGVATAIMNWLIWSRLSAEEKHHIEQSAGSTAGDLMVPGGPSVLPDTPLPEAIAIMLRERTKVLPVVGPDGRFLGAVDRADLLRSLAGSSGAAER